jgi:hypothetical protein
LQDPAIAVEQGREFILPERQLPVEDDIVSNPDTCEMNPVGLYLIDHS